jgi:hypothetical protein
VQRREVTLRRPLAAYRNTAHVFGSLNLASQFRHLQCFKHTISPHFDSEPIGFSNARDHLARFREISGKHRQQRTPGSSSYGTLHFGFRSPDLGISPQIDQLDTLERHDRLSGSLRHLVQPINIYLCISDTAQYPNSTFSHVFGPSTGFISVLCRTDRGSES